MKNIIYLPIEIKTREFESKLLLAIQLAKDGNKAVVCTRSYCNNLENKPKGVILAKSIAGFEINKIKMHKEYGNKYCTLDEEGILYASEESITFRFSQDSINSTDIIFVNGVNECDKIKKYYFVDDKIRLVGNPRFDFYKKPLSNTLKKDSILLQAKFGKYILILSRFGESNNKFKKEEQSWEEFYNKTLGLNMSKELIMMHNEFGAYSKKIFESFLNMIPVISKEFKEYTIIVRPHPNEKIDTWINATKNLENVKVIFEGSVGSWIQGAEFVIHNGCTTAIESYFLQKPIISYMPYSSEKYDLHIANMTGIKCKSLEEVVSAGKSILKHNYKRVIIDEELKKYIYNIDINSYELLSKEISILGNSISNSKIGKLEQNYLKILLKKIIFRFKKSDKIAKFPSTDLKEVKSKIENICNNLDIPSNEIKVKEVDFNSFLLYKK